MRKSFFGLAVLFGFLLASNLYASEVSLVTGGFKNKSQKVNGQKAGSMTSIEVGGRWSEMLTDQAAWFVEPGLKFVSYSAPSGVKSPDDGVSLTVKGGLRWYFIEFSEMVVPYVSGAVGLVSSKYASEDFGTQYETTGLFYWGSGGLRLNVAKQVFFEVEVDAFESAFFGTTKEEDVQKGDKTDTTSFEIYADSMGNTNTATFSVGVRL